MNFKMVKSEIVKLTVRENADVTDIDVVVGWMMWYRLLLERWCGGEKEN
jgi:hypothetical protein